MRRRNTRRPFPLMFLEGNSLYHRRGA